MWALKSLQSDDAGAPPLPVPLACATGLQHDLPRTSSPSRQHNGCLSGWANLRISVVWRHVFDCNAKTQLSYKTPLVSCVQTWYYFNHYRNDVWYIKALVIAVWLFDTTHQTLISHTVYYYLISNYANPTSLDHLVWSILLEVLFNGFIGLLVQGFLALRVWRLSNENTVLTTTVGALVLAEFGSSVAFTIKSMRLHTWADLAQLKGLSITVNIVGVVADIFIASALFFFLHRSRTGFKRSDTMIGRLILFTVSTGFLTSLCAIGSLVSILVWGHTLIYVAFYFSLGRLYSNSVLATLNARKSIRGLGEDTDELSFSLESFAKSGSKPLTSSRPTNISIKIDTMQDYQSRDSRQQEPESATTAEPPV